MRHLPDTLFQVFVDLDLEGWSSSDVETSLEDAATTAAEAWPVKFEDAHPRDCVRVLRIDLCLETNLPEATSDVTEDAIALIEKWADLAA